MGIRDDLKNNILIFDGAMGTMLQEEGLKAGEIPEILNITSPSTIVKIHKKYIGAGSRIITTNTFGANSIKLNGSGYTLNQIIYSAVQNAKEAIGNESAYIALDIGPIGELLEPMGTLKFEEAYNIFKDQIVAGVKSGVDLILIETMTDLYEAKAAVLAAKENSNLPVFCTMSFEEDGRTFTGCNPISMVLVLQGLGVDALGINCSLGPKEIEPILDEILRVSKVPVMVQPNAGLPSIIDGKTIFNVNPEKFSIYGRKFIEKGVRIIGGCCGTTDKHIYALEKNIKNVELKNINPIDSISGICTATKFVILDEVKVIGEKINPTGKKLFRQALINEDIDFILKEAIDQVEAGADILDVNVGLPEIDEEKTMVKIIKEIQSILNVPLQIDSTNPKVIEGGLRVYNGKAIVNSVNGEDKILDSILPIVKKYGAAVIGLTLDERGIPSSAVDRFKIAEKIVRRGEEYGIPREDIYIDCLTLTAAAQQEGVKETLNAIRLVKENLKVKTVLGVSNVSFGLPNRGLLNRTFLSASLFAGLDLPIINPMDTDMMDVIRASQVLWNEDRGSKKYLKYIENKVSNEISEEKVIDNKQLDLFNIIVKGVKEEAKNATKKLLEHTEPLELINKYIIPALDLVGERYGSGDIFLPQLIQSAETVKNSFEIIKESVSKDSKPQISKGKIILTTVKGDIHDIGKNIVKVLLESYNYEVIDLGKDVPKEEIIEKAVNNNVKLIGLSALMTTTVRSMEDTILELKRINPEFIIMVGGAVLNKEYADIIKADYYAKDTKEAINIAKIVLG